MMTTFLLILSKVVFAATIRTPLLRYGERGPERAGRQEPAEALTLPVSPESRFRHDTNASMNILVTGGTGALGREVVEKLRAAGHTARVLSRKPGAQAWRFQPVDPAEVADRLVGVVTGAPAGLLPDFGGPEIRDLGSLAVTWLAARQFHKRLVNLPLPFKFSRQFAEGRLLCPEHKDGTTTFEQYLENRYPRQS
jgi:hypothetical protein